MNRTFVSKSELANTRTYVESMISRVRKDLKSNGLTFNHSLVGSAGRNLATKTINGFDLDYVFEFAITDNKNKKLNSKLKQVVLQSIEKNKSENSKVNDSTSSIHYFTKDSQGNISIQSDIVIVINRTIKNKKLIIKGKGGNYHEEEIKNHSNLFQKFEKIKANNFEKFKKLYLSNLENKSANQCSYEVFLETVNSFNV